MLANLVPNFRNCLHCFNSETGFFVCLMWGSSGLFFWVFPQKLWLHIIFFFVLNHFYTLGDDWCVRAKTVTSPGTCHLNRMELKL